MKIIISKLNLIKNPTNVVICKSNFNESSVEHYYNYGYTSTPFLASNPTIGIKNAVIAVENNHLVCNFTRNNFENEENYFKITNNTKTKLIAAYGPFSIHKWLFLLFLENF